MGLCHVHGYPFCCLYYNILDLEEHIRIFLLESRGALRIEKIGAYKMVDFNNDIILQILVVRSLF